MTVISSVCTPFATAVPSTATAVELPASVTFGVKFTPAVCVITMESVKSIVWNVTTLDTDERTVNVTTPAASEGPDAALIVTPVDPPAAIASKTEWPTTGVAPSASSSVTVISSVSTLSATAVPSRATSVD